MLDHLDLEVSLTSLVEAISPVSAPLSLASKHIHQRQSSVATSSVDTSEVGFGSPTPAMRQTRLRHSMVRYSQEPRSNDVHHTSIQSIHGDVSDLIAQTLNDTTTSSAEDSSRSSHISTSSMRSSPCPAPRHRHVPMLRNKALPLPAFRFPQPATEPGDSKPDVLNSRSWFACLTPDP